MKLIFVLLFVALTGCATATVTPTLTVEQTHDRPHHFYLDEDDADMTADERVVPSTILYVHDVL